MGDLARPGHVVLLGDSVFDNGAYTGGGPDVVTQLRALLPNGWRASLLALDGSTIADLEGQVAGLPSDTSHQVISIGGNDVLGLLGMLGHRVKTLGDALLRLAGAAESFERDYRAAVDRACAAGPVTTLCTIYNGNLDAPEAQEFLSKPAAARAGLRAFNDAILRVSFERHLAVIDLRLVCSEPEDYANPIEPSSRGGAKIARAIIRTVGLESTPSSRVVW
jgi:GDSL-like Lipase/Acylhydrolase family